MKLYILIVCLLVAVTQAHPRHRHTGPPPTDADGNIIKPTGHPEGGEGHTRPPTTEGLKRRQGPTGPPPPGHTGSPPTEGLKRRQGPTGPPPPGREPHFIHFIMHVKDCQEDPNGEHCDRLEGACDQAGKFCDIVTAIRDIDFETCIKCHENRPTAMPEGTPTPPAACQECHDLVMKVREFFEEHHPRPTTAAPSKRREMHPTGDFEHGTRPPFDVIKDCLDDENSHDICAEILEHIKDHTGRPGRPGGPRHTTTVPA